jgi:hypothetical protein
MVMEVMKNEEFSLKTYFACYWDEPLQKKSNIPKIFGNILKSCKYSQYSNFSQIQQLFPITPEKRRKFQ